MKRLILLLQQLFKRPLMIKNKIFSDSLIYFSAQIINKLLPFLLIPLITRYLTPEEYGLVTSFNVVLGLSAVFVGLSMNGAINVTYFKHSHEEMKTYVFMALLILISSLIISLTSVYILSDYFTSITHLSELWIILAIITAFFQFITFINLALWQAEQKAKYYGVYEILQSLLLSLLTVLFLVVMNIKEEGVIVSIATAIIFFGMLSTIFLWKRDYISLIYRKEDLKDLLHFGLPMIPHQLSGWVPTQYDKIFVLSMLGLSAAGLYSIGYQFGMIISILTLAFNKAWSPFLFKKLATSPTLAEKVVLVKYTYLYFVSIIIIATLITFIAPYLLLWYVGDQYAGSIEVVSVITFAFAFNGMYFMVVNYLFFMKKTYILAIITFSNSVLYIILSYFLLNKYGLLGVAYATLLSYFLAFILVWIASQKTYPMPWKFWKHDIE